MSVYSECLIYIANASDPGTLYGDVRGLLSKASDRDYPEDHQIKHLQRLADAKYEQLRQQDNNTERR